MTPNLHLKRAREGRGLSQARLAEEIGTTGGNISRWERGISFPYPHFREQLCLFFGTDVEALGLAEREGLESVIEKQREQPVRALFCDPTVPLPPVEGGGLVGREEMERLMSRQLCARKNVAFYGLPGVGKTTLATALVHDQQVIETFCDGILWAGLGPRANVLSHLSRWETLLGLGATDAASIDARVIALRAAIGERRLLLVLDDAWEIETVLNFKIGGPNCAFLVTTRFPRIALSFAGEGAMFLRELSRKDGLALLSRLAPAAVTFDMPAAELLVKEGGGLPLALTLMGRYLQTQVYDGQPRRIRAAITRLRDANQRLQLSEPQALLERSPNQATEASLSLQSAIAVSDRYLDEEARATLRALAIFPPKPNSFLEEAAIAVSQLPIEALDALTDAGLLESGEPGRYMLHQTIADYARANLTETAASDRMVAFMVDYIEVHSEDYEALERESSNVLAALNHAFASGLLTKFVRGITTFTPFLLARRLYDLAGLHLQRAYHTALWQRDAASMATILLYLGHIALRRGGYSQAEVYLRDGINVARESERHKCLCHLLAALTINTMCQENYVQAERYALEGLALARQDKDHPCLYDLLVCLALLTEIRGDAVQKAAYLHEGQAYRQQNNFLPLIGPLLSETNGRDTGSRAILLLKRLLRSTGV